MRPRTLSALVSAVLAVVVLAGCSRSNVGTAATVNGQRITESDVNRYVTPKAQPVTVTDQSGASTQVSPRAFVVEILVYNKLLRDLLARTKQGAPSAGEMARLTKTVLAGKTAKQLANSQHVTGYTDAFNQELLRRFAYAQALSEAQQKGTDVNKLAQKLDVKVKVSPRYGQWDPKNLTIDTRPEAAVPSFVTLQPTPAAAP